MPETDEVKRLKLRLSVADDLCEILRLGRAIERAEKPEQKQEAEPEPEWRYNPGRSTAAELASDLAYLHRQIPKAETLQELEKIGAEVAEQEEAVAQAAARENYEEWQAAPKKESDPWRPDQALRVELYRRPDLAASDVVEERAEVLRRAPEEHLAEHAAAILKEASARVGLPVSAWAEADAMKAEILNKIWRLRAPEPPDPQPPEDDEQPTGSNTDYMYAMAEKGHWNTMMDAQGCKLPGAGVPYSTCGLWRFMACQYDNYAKRISHSCGRLSCPTCVRRAGGRASVKIARRSWLWRLKVQQDTKGNKNPYPSHVIESISPSSDYWHWSHQKRARVLADCRKIAGITGGVSITHLWRFSHDGKRTPKYEPHEHIIGFGWVSPTAHDDIRQKYGISVIYKKVENGTLKTRDDVRNVAMYLLSHCAVKPKGHSYKWFGDLSYNKINTAELERYVDLEMLAEDNEIEKSKSCKECGAQLVPAKLTPEALRDRRMWPPDQDQESGCLWPSGFIACLDLKLERITCYTEDWEEETVKTKLEEDEIKRKRSIEKRAVAVARVPGQGRLGV